MSGIVKESDNLYIQVKKATTPLIIGVLLAFTLKYLMLIQTGQLDCTKFDVVLLCYITIIVVLEVVLGVIEHLKDKGIISKTFYQMNKPTEE